MIELLIEPLSFGTTWRALVEILILGALGGILSSWVVLYRLSYGAESLAHGMLPGLVLAALVGLPLLVGGLVGILVAGILVAVAARMPMAEPDTSARGRTDCRAIHAISACVVANRERRKAALRSELRPSQ